MGAFHTILMEGLFYESDGKLQTDRGDFVDEMLRPMIGEDIHLAVHYLPPIPIDSSKWGGGCCMWQPNPCPAGHHENPDRLLNVTARGWLGQTDGQWWVEQLDGKRVMIPFNLLDGHQARVAAASVFDVEAMRDSLGSITPDQVETLGAQARDLRDLLANLQDHLKKGA